MCGISGVIGFSKDAGLRIVQRMNKSIIHRGPDDEGIFAVDGFAFAVRRLSIIDLKGGHQPIHAADNIGISFNGEIYNYRELREQMISKGIGFKTKSDTEVVLNLYRNDPVGWLERLNGMFGLCIYDPLKKIVCLARDRMGIKPLYYAKVNNHFYFASEIKAILAALDKKPEINKKALHHYLTLRYVPSPETIWQDIFKLEPGCSLIYDLTAGNFRFKRYWKTVFNSESLSCSRNYLKEFEELFLESVEMHLVTSDVPVGMMLSGGLDSSSVAAAAVEMGHKNFHTFNVSFSEGGEFSETDYAREVSKYIGSTHYEIVIGQKEFLDFIPEMVWYSDEPLADLSSVPLYYVARLARQHVKVVLTGEGSDELFAGYDIEALARRLDRLRMLEKTLPSPVLKALVKIVPKRFSVVLQTLAESGWSGYLKGRITHMTDYWSEEEKQGLWKEIPEGIEHTDTLVKSWYSDTVSLHPIDQLQEVYCRSWLVEDLLMKADKMSMANSLELRVPFLHNPLIEWALKLPLEWKVGGGNCGYVSKRILREFARTRLPPRIIKRSKQGFPVPAYKWLREELGYWAEDLLIKNNNFLKNLFNLSVVKQVLLKALAGDEKDTHKIWSLIVLEYWGRKWL